MKLFDSLFYHGGKIKSFFNFLATIWNSKCHHQFDTTVKNVKHDFFWKRQQKAKIRKKHSSLKRQNCFGHIYSVKNVNRRITENYNQQKILLSFRKQKNVTIQLRPNFFLFLLISAMMVVHDQVFLPLQCLYQTGSLNA